MAAKLMERFSMFRKNQKHDADACACAATPHAAHTRPRVSDSLRKDCPEVDLDRYVPAGIIPLHPEATDDPLTLCWVVSPFKLPFAGELVSAPGLDDLMGTVIERIVVGPDNLFITLKDDQSWSQVAPVVRTGLNHALSRASAWKGGPDAVPLSEDDVLRLCAEELVEGPIGDIARAHGGRIDLTSVQDGVVTVKMSGACRGCPAAMITMHQRLERQLRRRAPQLVSVETSNS